jgi:hypothetical protein
MEAREVQTIPLNSVLLDAMIDYTAWYNARFGSIQPESYVFAFGNHGRTIRRARS